MAGRGSRKARSKSGSAVKFVKRGLVLTSIIALGAVIAAYAVWLPINQRAIRNVDTINEKLVVKNIIPSVVKASDGTILYRIESQRRTKIDILSLPKFVRYAIVAAEDRRFFEHHGVDFRAFFRSAFLAVKAGHTSQGASTLEMQLAKQMVNGDERTLQRKLNDIATAQQIENLKTKDQILDIYMNEAYFGEGAFGIEAAAETYFNKHAISLTLPEAAMLARCVRHPSRENPVRDYDGSIDRMKYVLGVMHEEDWITDDQYEKACESRPKISKSASQGLRYINEKAGYFVEHVLQQFSQDNPTIDLKEGGYTIYTTLNYNLQLAAVKALRTTLRENRGRLVTTGAFLEMNSDGRILAEVGGPDFHRSKYNIITMGKGRQPGSSFKPFVYAAALNEGVLHMGDSVSNEAIFRTRQGVPWEPKNNGREFIGGRVSLEEAFKNSMNLPAIHTGLAVTPESVVSYARDTFGIQADLHPWDSIAIGTEEVRPLEMARGYSVFMLHGKRVEPFPIDYITGPDGETIKKYESQVTDTGLKGEVCDDIAELMRDVVTSGTGTAAIDVPDARGKTGTTQDAKDAWFCGYSDGLIGIAWVGNAVHRKNKPDAYRPMASSVYGGTVSAGMWAQVMMAAHDMKLAHVPVAPEADMVAIRTKRKHPATDDENPNPDVTPDDSNTKPETPVLTPENSPGDIGDPAPPSDDDPSATKPKSRRKDRSDGDNSEPHQSNDVPPAPPTDNSDDTPPPPPKRVTQRSTDDDAQYVTVEICADTGMRATRYCPETRPVKFRKGTEPRQFCRLHTGN